MNTQRVYLAAATSWDVNFPIFSEFTQRRCIQYEIVDATQEIWI